MIKLSVCFEDKYCFEEQLEMCRELEFGHMEISEHFKDDKFIDLNDAAFKKTILNNKVLVSMVNLKNTENILNFAYIKEIIKKCSLCEIEYINLVGANISENDSFFHDIKNCLKVYNVKLCIENKFGTLSNSNENLNAFFKNNDFSGYPLIFNPLEFAKSKEHPFLNIFYKARYKNNIKHLRINDGLFIDASPQLPGGGNCEIKELISALKARSFDGYFSFAPYFENQSIEDYKMIYKSFEKIMLNM